jgi:hypothetical protein
VARGRGLLVAVGLVAALGCGHEPIPTELIGRWTSDDPRYADRSLEIGAETIAFGLGGGLRMAYRARGSERGSDASDGALYQLYYDSPGEPERALSLRVAAPGHLRIENHSELWTRTGAPGTGG